MTSLQSPAYLWSRVIHLSWRWRRYVPPKHQFKPEPHGATSQKAIFFRVDYWSPLYRSLKVAVLGPVFGPPLYIHKYIDHHDWYFSFTRIPHHRGKI
jgi:hypothetical protein